MLFESVQADAGVTYLSKNWLTNLNHKQLKPFFYQMHLRLAGGENQGRIRHFLPTQAYTISILVPL